MRPGNAVYLGARYEAGRPEQARHIDLLNLAALQTLSQRGQAFSVPADQMPDGVDAAALVRF